jgi:hypothetical protein
MDEKCICGPLGVRVRHGHGRGSCSPSPGLVTKGAPISSVMSVSFHFTIFAIFLQLIANIYIRMVANKLRLRGNSVKATMAYIKVAKKRVKPFLSGHHETKRPRVAPPERLGGSASRRRLELRPGRPSAVVAGLAAVAAAPASEGGAGGARGGRGELRLRGFRRRRIWRFPAGRRPGVAGGLRRGLLDEAGGGVRG